MAKQLTKTTKDGKPYTRPPEIEANIDGTSGLPLEVVQERLAVAARTDPKFLTPECIVHLVRQALEDGDEARLGILHEALMRRVAHILRYKIPERGGFDAEDVRLAVASELNCLIVAGGNDLDFYECRFNLALRNLYIPKLRNLNEVEEVEFDDQVEHDDDHSISDQKQFEFSADLEAAIRCLSPKERQAYSLVEISGCAIESKDPTESTASEQMGLSSRMVSNYLKSAKAKLAKILKDYKS